LAYALFDADRAGSLRLHVRVDERAAGFLALGLAKVGDAPVAVVTTSGTAAGNLLPAVLEASHAHLPLVVVTADRPAGLRHTGANQTTDQTRLYGVHVRAAVELADAGGRPEQMRHELTRALALARGLRTRQPGPVQVNVAFNDPLTPDLGLPGVGLLGAELMGAGAERPGVRVGRSRPGPTLDLPAGPRTVIVAGDLPPPAGLAVAELAAASRAPLLAEPSSNARCGPSACATARLLAATGLADQVQRVVVYGHPTLSRSVGRLLQRPDVELVVVSPYADWPDPGTAASLITDGVTLEPDPSGWLAQWQAADTALSGRLQTLLSRRSVLTGPALASALWRRLSAADVLVAGASHPVRDLDLAPISADPPVVYANRGLSGIDGTVSTAVGLALASDRPASALLGDLTFLHDVGGLLIGPGEPRPDLRIVVANDDGGSIFATLEHAEPARRASFERIFGTPHGLTLSAIAAAYGTRVSKVTAAAELDEVLADSPSGLEVVEVVVDRRDRRALDAEIGALAASI
jgi:2-succinyl-5-enolpyruvyl-6-hydroxy-3-cyclohexene-1-carboxylate synthase